jgi:hypothetical protein
LPGQYPLRLKHRDLFSRPLPEEDFLEFYQAMKKPGKLQALLAKPD